MKNSPIITLVCLGVILWIYRIVFSATPIIGGDYINLWPSHVDQFRQFAFSAWDSNINFGWSTVGLLHYAPYSHLIGQVGAIIKNAVILERIFWWLPFIALSFFSTSYLFIKLFNEKYFWIISPFLFLCNTYTLLLIGGGQIAGVGLAFSIAPLILLKAIQLIQEEEVFDKKLQGSLFLSLLLSLQLMFDMRITYVTLCGVGLYYLFSLFLSFKLWRRALWIFVIPGIVTLLLHAFWIVPLLLYRQNPIDQFGAAYTTLDAVKFFSFGFFENSLSLLHPNWPENIFGKVGFMKPEFLLLPILAYSSLLFLRAKDSVRESQAVLFFCLLGLIGAFLAKGANEPFGELYLWMFERIPGFVMFRDPTKWYTLVVISYAVLIPFSISKIYAWLQTSLENSRMQLGVNKYVPNLFLLFVIVYFLVLIRPALFGELTGTYRYTVNPSEYEKLRVYLQNDTAYGRALWIPSFSRFSDHQLNHPVNYGVDTITALVDSSAAAKIESSKKLIQDGSIRYVIVPFDPLGELFVSDRKYDEKKYKDTMNSVGKISWLKKVEGFEKIGVFQATSVKDHFWSPEEIQITYQQVSPAEYKVQLGNVRSNSRLIFSEAYDPGWKAVIDDQEINPEKFEGKLNAFVIPPNVKTLTVLYKPQVWVNRGLVLTAVSVVAVIWLIGYLFLRDRRKKA